jgi:polyisoprenoid-binding protein YceI
LPLRIFIPGRVVLAGLAAVVLLGCSRGVAPGDSTGTASVRPPAAGASVQTQVDPGRDALGQPIASESGQVFHIVPEQSEASYDIQEKLAFLPLPSRAVGRTKAIEGRFTLMMGAAPRVEDAQFSVDLRTLTSDQRRRDQLIRSQWLESDAYPMAEFRATRIEQLPAGYVEGDEVPVQITGDMTIRTTTRELTFDTRASMQGGTIRGTATTFLLMRDFGFEPPNIANAVSVEDGVNLTVSFTAQTQS